MSNDEIKALEQIAIYRAESKADARSRNHYGHRYTELKSENHTLKVQLAKLTEQTVKECDRAYYGGVIVGVVLTPIAVCLYSWMKGVV